jgi:hypothetical protein
MAGTRGRSGPPGNQNAFRHGLSTVVRRRAEGELTEAEQDIRADILAGLIADKGGEQQIGTAWQKKQRKSHQGENPKLPNGVSVNRWPSRRVVPSSSGWHGKL